MQQIKFNSKTLPKGRGPIARPRVSFHPSGRITINHAAAKAMNVCPGSLISIIQDADNPADWYIRPNDPDGWQLRGDGIRGLVFNHTPLQRAILDYFDRPRHRGCSVKVAADPIDDKGVKLFGIFGFCEFKKI